MNTTWRRAVDPQEHKFRTLLNLVLEKFPDSHANARRNGSSPGASAWRARSSQAEQILPDPPGTLELQGRRLAALVLDEEWRIHPRLSVVYLDSSLAIVNKGAGCYPCRPRSPTCRR